MEKLSTAGIESLKKLRNEYLEGNSWYKAFFSFAHEYGDVEALCALKTLNDKQCHRYGQGHSAYKFQHDYYCQSKIDSLKLKQSRALLTKAMKTGKIDPNL